MRWRFPLFFCSLLTSVGKWYFVFLDSARPHTPTHSLMYVLYTHTQAITSPSTHNYTHSYPPPLYRQNQLHPHMPLMGMCWSNKNILYNNFNTTMKIFFNLLTTRTATYLYCKYLCSNLHDQYLTQQLCKTVAQLNSARLTKVVSISDEIFALRQQRQPKKHKR